MSRLHTRVNLIPVIAKADTMTDEEIADFKTRVRSPHISLTGRHTKFLTGSRRHRLSQDSHLPGPYVRERGRGVPGRGRGDC